MSTRSIFLCESRVFDCSILVKYGEFYTIHWVFGVTHILLPLIQKKVFTNSTNGSRNIQALELLIDSWTLEEIYLSFKDRRLVLASCINLRWSTSRVKSGPRHSSFQHYEVGNGAYWKQGNIPWEFLLIQHWYLIFVMFSSFQAKCWMFFYCTLFLSIACANIHAMIASIKEDLFLPWYTKKKIQDPFYKLELIGADYCGSNFYTIGSCGLQTEIMNEKGGCFFFDCYLYSQMYHVC